MDVGNGRMTIKVKEVLGVLNKSSKLMKYEYQLLKDMDTATQGWCWFGTLEYAPPQGLKFNSLRCEFGWTNLTS